ncbi:MAG TPA: hypothetical protein VKB80_14700 [Kofleriaceae bacterium]|nr:hypothetical protein [Kofleriaceae bacterium]
MTRRSLAALAAPLVLAALSPGRPASAKSGETYVFLVSRVDLGKGVPGEVEAQVAARLGAAIEQNEELEARLGEGAPDPDADPKKFKSYLKSRRQRAFKVNVEVSQYSTEVEPAARGLRGQPARKDSQYLTVRIALRLFGETVPDRTMAFTGDGSAAVKLEVGKTVRPRDREEAASAAIDQAVASAIAESLTRLKAPPAASPPKKKPGKK